MSSVIAFAGSAAHAADHLGRDSVGTFQLKKNSVTGPKVRDRSPSGADIDATLPTVADAQRAGADSADSARNTASAPWRSGG